MKAYLADVVSGLKEQINRLSLEVDGQQTNFTLSGAFTVRRDRISYDGRISAHQDGKDINAVMFPPIDIFPQVESYVSGQGYTVEREVNPGFYILKFEIEVDGRSSQIRREEAAVKRLFGKELVARIYTL